METSLEDFRNCYGLYTQISLCWKLSPKCVSVELKGPLRGGA
jgi:hypothetical protein